MNILEVKEYPFTLNQGEFVGSPFDVMYQVDRNIYSSDPDAKKQVYSVHDSLSGEHVALKMHDPSLTEMVEAELATAEMFKSQPGFVPFRGYGEHRTKDGLYVPYLAYDFEDRGSLEAEISETLLPDLEKIEELTVVFHGVATALHAVHSEGIVYRDVKPANILQGDAGEGLLCDYDIATPRGQYNTVKGTVGYIAPEAIYQGLVIPANDVFGIGVTMYRALTHRFPWSADSVNDFCIDIDRGDTPVFPDIYNPAVPAALSKLVMNCIKLRHDSRIGTSHLPTAIEAVSA